MTNQIVVFQGETIHHPILVENHTVADGDIGHVAIRNIKDSVVWEKDLTFDLKDSGSNEVIIKIAADENMKLFKPDRLYKWGLTCRHGDGIVKVLIGSAPFIVRSAVARKEGIESVADETPEPDATNEIPEPDEEPPADPPSEPLPMPLTFISETPDMVITPKWTETGTIEYSLDNGSTWLPATSETPLPATKEVRMRGQMSAARLFTASSATNAWKITGTGVRIKGNLNELLDYTNPPTTIDPFCYSQMFRGCTTVIEAPTLPATTISTYCYTHMFNACTSLTKAPGLSAVTLKDNCYTGMFYGCTSLTEAPDLPATMLAVSCYASMFNQCSSLAKATALPATALMESCYSSMFSGTLIAEAPDLPATMLANSCYSSMFRVCPLLTKAPALPATTLTDSCYNRMFEGCKSLTKAPALPATTLTATCYYYMYNDCTSLTEAPDLPATTLMTECYHSMFRSCSSMKKIKVFFTSWIGAGTQSWMQGVPADGEFHCPAALPSQTGDSYIPAGWTRKTF